MPQSPVEISPTLTNTDQGKAVHRRWILLISICCWFSIVVQIDGVGSYPNMPEGPGLTADEFFNVREGVRLTEGISGSLFGEYTIKDVWDDSAHPLRPSPLGGHNPDHPPLGRIWLGVFHDLTKFIAPPTMPDDPSQTPWVTACARVGSATAFAILVFVVGTSATFWYGRSAGITASLGLILMPRVFGHAHLASLETVMGLSYCATVIHIARTWKPGQELSTKTIVVSGVLFGAALLTKIQAVFIAPVVAAWCLWHWRAKSVRILAIWGAIGGIVMFIGWPWLWLDPIDHLLMYFGRTTGRAEIYVWYLGEKIADRDVPWHYVPFMFLVTIPVGIHACGAVGLWRAIRSRITPAEQLLLGSAVLPMVVLSLPGIAVYDGERLFLVSFSLWAIFVGRGVSECFRFACKLSWHKWVIPVMWIAFIGQAWSLVQVSPCYLSYYSLANADRLGAEPCYWGDALTRSLLEKVAETVPPGSTVHIKPVMHPLFLTDLLAQSPVLARRKIQLKPYDESHRNEVRYWLIYRRNADLTPDLRGLPPGRIVMEVRRGGVQLAALIAAEP